VAARDLIFRFVGKVDDSAEKAGTKTERIMSGVADAAEKHSKRMIAFWGAIGSALGGVLLQGLNAVAGQFGAMFEEAREAAKVGATTEQIIKQTGGAANVTAEQIGDLAQSISEKTGIDDEAIQSSANLLLTFKNVRNELGKGNQIFDRATAAAQDLAAAGFGDAEGAAKMLGKALNDPLQGITALGRAGVTFSADQKKQIEQFVKQGDMLSAQKIIMGEVESQVGGVAEASASAADKLAVKWGNFLENLGTKLLPFADKAMDALGGLLDVVDDTIGPFIDKTLATVDALFNQDISTPQIDEIRRIIADLSAWFTTELMPRFAGIRDMFFEYLSGMGERLAPLAPKIMAIFGTVGQIITATLDLIKAAWDKWGVYLMDIVSIVFTNLINIAGPILEALRATINLVTSAIRGDWSGAWEALKTIFVSLLNVIINSAIGSFTLLQRAFATPLAWIQTRVTEWATQIRASWDSMWAWIGMKTGEAVEFVRSRIDAGLSLVRGVFENTVRGIGAVWDTLREAAAKPVRFVIGTVVNGVIGAWNTMAGVFGMSKMQPFQLGFAEGGYTGPGGKYQPAGVVHAGEYVITKDQVGRLGGPVQVAKLLAEWLAHARGYVQGGLVTWRGGTFSQLFASRLAAAEKLARAVFHVTQGGFRPSTSYSGTSHRGDAVDLSGPITAAVVQALRSVGIAAWDRTGMGRWIPHIHGVPLPGAGYAAGSAVWQAQDYLRGGNGLGGRDNGIGSGSRPAVNASGAASSGGAGAAFGTDMVRSALAGILDKARLAGSSPFAQLIAKVPSAIADGITTRAKKVFGFDTGGWLQPGATLAVNQTGRPEAVLTAEQWAGLLLALGRLVDELEAQRGQPLPAVIGRDQFDEAARLVVARELRR
jgi:TMP repeat superfamily protein